MLRSNVKESVKRLEELKQATLLRYLNNINLENNSDLYNEIMVHFANGELDDYYSSPIIDDLSEEEKNDLYNLSHEFMSLCFYTGESEYWAKSIDCVPWDDYELIALKIFDNYDFLLEITRDGKRETLEQMKIFQTKSGYTKTSVIDLLRNSFSNDQLLKTILIEMSKKDSLYNVFTDKQKAELCRFPEGTLYTSDGKIKNPLEFALELKDEFDDKEEKAYIDVSSSAALFSELKKIFEKTPIELIIADVSDRYVSQYGYFNGDEVRGKR